MNNILKYKGYTGTVNFHADDKIFHGSVMGITDVIGFEGADVVSLEKDFHNAVDDYIDTCRDIGKTPQKPFSGRFILRMDSTLHSSVALAAKSQNKSINAWVNDTCREAITSLGFGKK